MNLIRLLVWGLVLMAFTSKADADWRSKEDWELVNQTPDKSITLLYDPSSVTRKQNNIELWTVLSTTKPNTYTGQIYYSTKIRYILDCDNKRYKNMYLILTSEQMGKGNVILTSNSEQAGFANWEYASPGSLMATLFYLCK